MLGILAFGSLRNDPGEELEAATTSRQPMRTPFRVEFARVSEKRGRAPTLVPVVSGGAVVEAEVLVLNDSISEEDAASILWRRETGRIGGGQSYARPSSPRANQMLVDTLTDHEGFARVLYTNFPESGKLGDPMPGELARLAIGSISRRPRGRMASAT
jgi:acyl transferase domain-containing protein